MGHFILFLNEKGYLAKGKMKKVTAMENLETKDF